MKNALFRARRFSFSLFRFPLPSSRFPLWQHELNARLDREVVASEDCDGREGSVLTLRGPALGENRVALALERFAAHRGGEHAALAPAPDLLAGEILHLEVVRLSIGELQLEHLRRVVAHVQSEAELVRVVLRSG